MKVLCVGLAADNTFMHTVLSFVRSGIAVDVLDVAQLALSGELDIPLTDLPAATIDLHGTSYVLGSYSGAWVRLIDIADHAPNEALARRAAGIHTALLQLFGEAPIPVLNPPLRDNSNFSKVFHAVSLASAVGWQIPRSCLTTDPQVARRFMGSFPDGVIFKGASAAKTWATLYEPAKHDRRLRMLPNCPVLFQERIEGPDVRVHVVGDLAFAEAIDSSVLDYRTVRTNRFRPMSLPSEIAAGCTALTELCETPFLGVDFKIQRSSGAWFFLEANSMPSYQGYDLRANRAISRAMGNWLLRRACANTAV